MKLTKASLPKAFRTRITLAPNNTNPTGGGAFVKGNQLSTTENLTAEAHSKKMAAMYRGWETKARIRRGEKVVTVAQKEKKVQRQRVKLRETIMLEAREIQDMARLAAGDAMNVLKDIISDQTTRSSDKISAISLLLDRAYGKATQANVNTNIDATGKESDVSTVELDRRIKTALNRVEAIAGREGQAPEGKERPIDVRERDRNTGGSSIH